MHAEFIGREPEWLARRNLEFVMGEKRSLIEKAPDLALIASRSPRDCFGRRQAMRLKMGFRQAASRTVAHLGEGMPWMEFIVEGALASFDPESFARLLHIDSRGGSRFIWRQNQPAALTTAAEEAHIVAAPAALIAACDENDRAKSTLAPCRALP